MRLALFFLSAGASAWASTDTLPSCSYEATCTVSGLEGVCVDVDAGCCAGTATAGYCSGGNNIQCCTSAPCSTPLGSGTCLATSVCNGTTFPGFCVGPSDLQCCVSGPSPAPPTPSPPTPSGSYDRAAALSYAKVWWNSTNHDCSTSYTSCSPWSYWGEESCDEASHGGDCANFVSQCLLAGGHVPLTQSPCRGYPCGKEEVGAANLGSCLMQNYGWASACGAQMPPPASIVPGDVLVVRGSSCSDSEAHATMVSAVDYGGVGGDVRITCHSADSANKSYTAYASEFGYNQWLHFEG